MITDESKETKDEDSEYNEEDYKDIEDNLIDEIKKAPKFNKKKCVECNLLEDSDGTQLYSNLYPIIFKKDIEICEYPFKITPECHEENVILKILREASPELFKTYGYYQRSGNSFFGVRKIQKEKIFKALIVHRGWIEYKIIVQPSAHSSTIKRDQTHNFSEIQERVLYLVIREILSANPNVHFDRDNLYLENEKEEVQGYQNTYYVHDGYKISIQQAEIGICLVIGVKNKIKGKFSVLDFISNNKDEEIDKLIGRRFIPYEGSRSQVITNINYDKNPVNTIRNYKQETFNYADYYEKIWKKKIKDKKQPLIEVEIRGPQTKKRRYYVPELCYLVGINDEDTKDFEFMNQIIEKTRLTPDEKIKQIEKCIDLFVDTTERKSINNDQPGENLNTIFDDENNTSKKKLNYYGIEIKKLREYIEPYYVSQPSFSNGVKKELTIKDVNGVIPVGRENISTDDWICLYTVQAEKISFDLLKGFLKCCKGYRIRFKDNDSNWIPMKSQNFKDWTNTVEKELNKRKNCKFVMFLINNKNDKLYTPLKKHSLSTKGYVSQVIKYESIMKAMKGRRGPDSYFSKILLQINNKLGGCNYFLNLDPFIEDRKLMLIGVDSSHAWGKKTSKKNNKKTGVAMVATKDKYFSKFYSREEIILYDSHYSSTARRSISEFIEEAVSKYTKENGESPKNIIIYRQGIAHNQLNLIKLEALFVKQICNKLNINYYYVLVNTRTSIKFFEFNVTKSKHNYGEYKNPESGLIVLDQVTNINRFEFYIQPQKVNIGSATPTYFHVAFGDMNFPELLIQLTCWTTFIYSNWQNAVRIPHVIKMADKLANMTAKFTQSELNKNLYDKQSFL